MESARWALSIQLGSTAQGHGVGNINVNNLAVATDSHVWSNRVLANYSYNS